MIGARATASAEPDLGAATRAAWRQARLSQPGWGGAALGRRLEVVRRLRRLIARQGSDLAAAVDHPQRRSAAETLAAEVLPLADACRFLERRAGRLLRPRRLAGWGPPWMGGSRLEERREPLGVVLVVAPGNYPLFLPGVQAIQALAAGNAVLWKPAAGGRAAAVAVEQMLARAGLPGGLLSVLGEEVEAARAAIEAGVDKVLFTGSADTGRAVLADLAPRLTPATLELSGCDTVIVRRDADLELVVDALIFGLTLNGGATCMAPRRVFVAAELADRLEEGLAARAAQLAAVRLPQAAASQALEMARDAVARGARRVAGSLPESGAMRPLVLAGCDPEMKLFAADLMAPILGLSAVADDEQALAAAARCPYALGAAIFSRRGGHQLARRLRAGVVVINDLIAPTADPRLAFGGRGASGYGLTRGAAGLLELTAAKTVVSRRTAWRPHLRPPGANDEGLLRGLLRLLHGGPAEWLTGCRELIAASKNKNDDKGSRAGGPRDSADGGFDR